MDSIKDVIAAAILFIGIVIVVVGLYFLVLIFSGWLISMAWNFVAPVFGFPSLTVYQAAAIWFIITSIAGVFGAHMKNSTSKS